MDLAGIDAVRAEIALDVADLVDGARIRQDPGRFLSAVGKLESLLGRLPVEGVSSGEPVESVEDVPDPLAVVLGAGPEVGDGPDGV